MANPLRGSHVLTGLASRCAQEISSDDSASCLAFRASQGRQRRLIFPIYRDAGAVQRLLAFRVPDRPACCCMAGRCTGCQCLAYLHGWQNCLARSTATLTAAHLLQRRGGRRSDDQKTCDRGKGTTSKLAPGSGAGYRKRQDRNNDQLRQGHQPRLRVPSNPGFHVMDQLLAFQREAGLSVHPSSVPHVPAIGGTGCGW